MSENIQPDIWAYYGDIKPNNKLAAAGKPNQPKRIQRKRTPGWRKPPDAIYVGRPTRWGNPYRGDRAESVARYRADWVDYLHREPAARVRLKERLGGRDLICWCALDQPCHADVLLELANALDIGERPR